VDKFDLVLQASDSPKTRIRDHVRGLILSGELSAGEKLPSMPVLARLWKTHVPTVHAAFQDLHREGLTIPRQGKGIFVAERKRKLDNVAVYTTVEALSDPTMWFRRSVVNEVNTILRARGATTRTWVDPRPHEERDQTFRELEDLAHKGEIQGLIMLAIKPEYADWTQTLPIATSCIGSLSLPTTVRSDQRTMIELAIGRLAEQGCRSVGMILAYHPGYSDAGTSPSRKSPPVILQAFIETAGKYGLEIRNSWIRMPEKGTSVRNYEQAEFAYREFHALWAQDEHPDGLIVDPDTGVEGAITAILERRVDIPRELKVVFHRNENHRFICPFPASFVTTSEREYAEALVQQLERQLNGEPCQAIFIPHRLSTEFSTASCGGFSSLPSPARCSFWPERL